jgi:hypothetical protein
MLRRLGFTHELLSLIYRWDFIVIAASSRCFPAVSMTMERIAVRVIR